MGDLIAGRGRAHRGAGAVGRRGGVVEGKEPVPRDRLGSGARVAPLGEERCTEERVEREDGEDPRNSHMSMVTSIASFGKSP